MTPAEYQAAVIGYDQERKHANIIEAKKLRQLIAPYAKVPPSLNKVYKMLTGQVLIAEAADGDAGKRLLRKAARKPDGLTPDERAKNLAKKLRLLNG